MARSSTLAAENYLTKSLFLSNTLRAASVTLADCGVGVSLTIDPFPSYVGNSRAPLPGTVDLTKNYLIEPSILMGQL